MDKKIEENVVTTEVVESACKEASSPAESSEERSKGSSDLDTKSSSSERKRYSREQLMKLADSQTSRLRPKCLSPEFETPEGYWDPERWFRSFDLSRGSSPLSVGGRDRKRPLDLERELLMKRRSSDPRLRIKEEEEDSLGIVLSPQRKSFGTGCHVTVSNQGQHRRPTSPLEGDQRSGRRIGSGRIQIDRERDLRERDTGDRDSRERDRDPRERDLRDRDRDLRDPRDRDPRDFRDHDRRDFRDPRGRFDRDENRGFRDRFRREDSRENRDFGKRDYGFGDHGYGNKYDRGYRRDSYNQRDEEPEWFTAGPTSQTDTIELRGFEPVETSSKHNSVEEEEPKAEKPSTKADAVSVVDRNGSLETNESSSPEAQSPSSPTLVIAEEPKEDNNPATDFDFNDFFKIENIPGLAETLASEQDGMAMGGSGSRFSAWFSTGGGGHIPEGESSQNNSRRSSLNEEFGYLNEMISGQKSPIVPSPTPPNLLGQHRLFGTLGNSPEDQHQQTQLLEMLQQARRNVQVGIQSTPSDIRIPLNPNGTPPTALEVEADLKSLLLSGNHKGSIDPKSITPLTVPPSGKVTTVAELEASLKDMVLNNNNKLRMAEQGHHSRPPPLAERKRISPTAQVIGTSPPNMAAFNRLLGLMKASGALNETPKMPRRNDGRPISPVSIPGQQKPIFSAQQKNALQQEIMKAHHKAEQQHKQQQLQQQFREQQAKLQQQQLQEHLLAVMKQTAAVNKPPASPLAPQMASLQPPTSPRAPSPNVIQQTLQLQQPPSPRAPSPIMFGSQPPVHLTAPSPIHPSQSPGSQNTLSVTSLQAKSPAMARVPSPQELIVHTQAIMQNALLKKQLEDQKERFLRRQQDGGKSPNPVSQAEHAAQAIVSVSFPVPTLAQPQPKTTVPVSVSFTPTSVIKKMASDKAEEKERQARTSTPPVGGHPAEQKPPTLRIDQGSEDGSVSGDAQESRMLGTQEASEGDSASGHAMSETSSVESITLTVPQFPTVPPFVNQGESDTMSSEHDAHRNMSQPGMHQHGNKGQQDRGQRRALMGQGTMNTNIPTAASGPPNPVTQGRPIIKGAAAPPPPAASTQVQGAAVSQPKKTNPSPQAQRAIVGSQQNIPQNNPIDINKLMEQQRLQQQQQRVAPPSPNLPRPGVAGIPITGRMQMAPSVNPAANALLLQRHLMPGNLAQARGGVPPVNLNQLNQMAALQQAQQRMLDPRLQGVARPLYPGQPGAPVLGANPRVGLPVTSLSLPPSAISRAISPQPQVAQSVMAWSNKGIGEIPGALSPGLPRNHPAVSQSNMKTGGEAPHLARWFNADILKQQLPGMPSMPLQNHKVLTVDEIERR